MAERAFGVKMGGDGGGSTDGPSGVESGRIVSASAFVIFVCTIKSRRWQAVMEEASTGCSSSV